MRILFLGETYRADAKTWIEGIELNLGKKIETKEVAFTPQRWRRLLFFARFLIELFFMRFQKPYDLVLAERATSYGFFALLVKAKVRVVAQQGITDAFPEEGFTGIYKRYFQRKVYKKADLVHAWGNVMTYAMLESGAAPSKIMVLPKGINLSHYKFRPQTQKEHEAIGIVTRSLSDIYRHEDILKAFAILKRRGVNASCWIVGDGVLRTKLEDLSKELEVEDRIRFFGRIDNKLLPELLAESNFYLAVPETEGVSASLFEAMASGSFPIVTDLPANRAFIRQGENGFLVPVGQPEILASKIEEYILNKDKYFDQVQLNRDFIESKVSFERNMKLIFERYLQLLEKKK
ncbi:MAG: glycosyltransferase [Mongoliibacter sp.]|uniref:glycosyltransferase n=1 Tax=Mongoliibacter sp. TaxID=2022438 RepID=UPI0012F1C5D7|nr:glycosyltransferase [Mongoliibacter sp.]TVP46544.1 MAG: glycosyltransferase [Mongoliibacter sp.]